MQERNQIPTKIELKPPRYEFKCKKHGVLSYGWHQFIGPAENGLPELNKLFCLRCMTELFRSLGLEPMEVTKLEEPKVLDFKKKE